MYLLTSGPRPLASTTLHGTAHQSEPDSTPRPEKLPNPASGFQDPNCQTPSCSYSQILGAPDLKLAKILIAKFPKPPQLSTRVYHKYIYIYIYHPRKLLNLNFIVAGCCESKPVALLTELCGSSFRAFQGLEKSGLLVLWPLTP